MNTIIEEDTKKLKKENATHAEMLGTHIWDIKHIAMVSIHNLSNLIKMFSIKNHIII